MRIVNMARYLAFCCGFISLGVEVIWARYIGYAYQGSPKALGFVLFAFLCGIAFGSLLGKRLCERLDNPSDLMLKSSHWIIFSALIIALGPYAVAWAIEGEYQRWASFLAVAATSFCLSVSFPVVHHLGTLNSQDNQGKHFAGVYCLNVAGAALAPLLVGYLVLDHMTMQSAFFLFALAALLVVLTVRAIVARTLVDLPGFTSIALTVGTVVLWVNIAPHQLTNMVVTDKIIPHTTIETRQGVVTLIHDAKNESYGDIVMGGNIYDGRTNTSLQVNSNGLHRLALMAALHEQPKRVLMIGLSIGSWLAVIENFPGVEKIDVVEINPGYIQAAQRYEAQRMALKDPRVTVHIDDGRRWLRMHPQEKYDLIIMNTTFHWRSSSTNLLSREIMHEIQRHLQPGGILGFNATGSPDALRTAHEVFRFARRYSNFVYAADWDFTGRKTADRTRELYANLKSPYVKDFAPNEEQIKSFMALRFVDVATDERDFDRKLEVITDRNMITEFKYGRDFLR